MGPQQVRDRNERVVVVAVVVAAAAEGVVERVDFDRGTLMEQSRKVMTVQEVSGVLH